MKNSGNLYWIMGLAGSGKTTIAKKLQLSLQNLGHSSIVLDGDEIRNTLNLNGHGLQDRQKFGILYINIAKILTNQGYDVILSSIGMQKLFEIHAKKIIPNYYQILVQTDIKEIELRNNREFYNDKSSNVMGKDLTPESLNYDLIIKNDFTDNIDAIVDTCLRFINSKRSFQ